MKTNSKADLLAFDLGVCTNALSWHFDQAAFALSRPDRDIAFGLIVKIRAITSEFSEIKTDSPLEVALTRLAEWLPSVDTEWWYEACEQESWSAISRLGLEAPDEVYFNEVRRHVPDVRRELQSAVIDSVLVTARQRLLFQLGQLLDEGTRPPEDARRVLDYLLPESTHCRNGDPGWDKTSGGEPRPWIRRVTPGTLPLPPAWEHRVFMYVTQLGIDGVLRPLAKRLE